MIEQSQTFYQKVTTFFGIQCVNIVFRGYRYHYKKKKEKKQVSHFHITEDYKYMKNCL